MTIVSTERLAEVFVEVADTLVHDVDLIEFLQTVTTRTAELADTRAAGLLLVDPHGDLQFMAASDEATRLLELFQVQNPEGPCLDGFCTRASVINPDLREDGDRWPLLAPRAVQARSQGSARHPPATPGPRHRCSRPVQRPHGLA